MDVDTTSRKHGHEQILDQFASRKADILIGTQMIAKGHDFPHVTLVGVLAADMSLHMEDYRAAERTFQLLTQVAGRAGRAELPGRVLIQSYDPEHYSIQMASKQSYEEFYEQEIKLRQQMQYPPFTSLFTILLVGDQERKVITTAFELMEVMKYFNKKGAFELLGPTPAVLSKIKNQYRWRILIKCKEEDRLRKYALYCVQKYRQRKKIEDIHIHLDMNPMMMV